MTEPTLTGGCQCGAVRYALSRLPRYASICHCRMCQRATGQPFAAFAGVRTEELTWTRGKPSIFRSSNVAERGFCADCGTPLTYAFDGSGEISVAMGSLDDPEIMAPEKQYGIESKLFWCASLETLPGERTDEWWPAAITVASRQKPDRTS
jgi:hypothetical protein